MSALLTIVYALTMAFISWHVVMATVPQFITLWWIAHFVMIFSAIAKYMEEH